MKANCAKIRVEEKGMVAGLYKKKSHRSFWRGSKNIFEPGRKM
jgi:hypothetical protein